MAQDFEIKIELGGAIQGPLATAGVFRHLAAAVQDVAENGAFYWREAVARAPLWKGERDAYIASIKVERINDYRYEISSDYKFVQDIETGRPAYDLKRMLDTSTKVRRTKDGRRFLVIPMRHGTPGNSALSPDMPTAVYNLASALSFSSITGSGTRPSGEITHLVPGRGMIASRRRRDLASPFLSNPKTKQKYLVARREYDWGGRLGKRQLLRAGASKDEAKRYAGMYRFKGADGKTAGFLTFRMMVEGSAGWIIPARPGIHIAQNVADAIQRIAEPSFQAAIARDTGLAG